MLEVVRLKHAIDTNDLARVQALMTREPGLHAAPMGYGKDGPLTWVAECRVPWGPPSAARLAIAAWMLAHGSDVHQGGDGPLMRAALNGDRIPMMELLVAHGADVNAHWNGEYPIIFAPCEAVDPVALLWLLEHGARPDTAHGNALDYVIGSYVRKPELAQCIDILLAVGGSTRYREPAVLEVLRGRFRLGDDPSIVHLHYPDLDFGTTGGRMLTLAGGTLLHVAAEYLDLEAARLLLSAGADVNARGASGQTPLFHATTQFDDLGASMVELLLARGADPAIRACVPGHYERPGEMLECTALEYPKFLR